MEGGGDVERRREVDTIAGLKAGRATSSGVSLVQASAMATDATRRIRLEGLDHGRKPNSQDAGERTEDAAHAAESDASFRPSRS